MILPANHDLCFASATAALRVTAGRGVEEPVTAQRGPEFSFVTLMHFSAEESVGRG